MKIVRDTKDCYTFILYSDAKASGVLSGVPKFELSVFRANCRFAFSLAHYRSIGFLVIAFGKGFSIVYRR